MGICLIFALPGSNAAIFAPAKAQAQGYPSGPAAIETLTRSGFEHFYSLEYEQAINDFQKAAAASPDDPRVLNHLLEAVLFQTLYRYDALDTSLYTHQRFISSKQAPAEPATRQRIRDLAAQSLALPEKRLKANPNDVQALYAHGVAKGLLGTYLALVEHSWITALRNALAARSDHEQALKLAPDFIDAKTVVGIHNYVVGSLPLPIKAMAGLTGIHGDKRKGLDYLFEVARARVESSEDARVALGLFLRREERFKEAVEVVHTLVEQHPRNFLFALEEANLMKDAGQGPAAIAAFHALLRRYAEGKYPEAHVELAQYDLAETLRGQEQLPEALQNYLAAGKSQSHNHELRQRALLAAGEISDLLAQRAAALQQYQAVIEVDSSSGEAAMARKYLGSPYHGR